MTRTEAAEILRQHNRWRRGETDQQQHSPAEVGEAIEIIVQTYYDQRRALESVGHMIYNRMPSVPDGEKMIARINHGLNTDNGWNA